MPNLCAACKRLTDSERGRCEAFPDGIPDAIFKQGGDHRKPVYADRGLQFELKSGEKQALEQWERLDRLRSDDPIEDAGLRP